MKTSVENLLDKSDTELHSLALSVPTPDLEEILNGIWTSIRESNLTSGQPCGEGAAKVLSYARIALTLAEHNPDETLQADAWRMMAYALSASERYADSVAYYEKALAALDRLGKEELAARTRIGFVGALQVAGRYEEAVQVALAADRWFLEHNDPAGHARLCTNLGNVYFRQDDPKRSLDYHFEAAKIFEQIGDERALAQAHLNLGNVLSGLDRFEESDLNYARSEHLSLKLGLTDLGAHAQYNRAYLYFLRGRYSDALGSFTKLGSQFEEQGSLRHSALCELDEAEIYLQLNLSADADRLAQRAARTFETLMMRYEEAKAIAIAGVANTHNLRFVEALELFRISRDKFQQEQNHYWINVLDLYRAEVFFSMKRYWEARSFATVSQQGFEKLGIPSKVAVALMLLARIALSAGRRSEARDHARAALDIAENYKLPLLLFSAYSINAQVADDMKERTEAMRLYELAANDIEARWSHLHQDDLRVTFLRGKQQVYEALVRLVLGTSDAPEVIGSAYGWCERAKSRGLIDLLSHHLPAVKPKNDDELLQRINRLHEELNSHYLRSRPEANELMLSPNAAEIELREHELARSLRELSRKDPEYVSLQRTATKSLDEIQSMLNGDTTLVEYFVEGDEVLAFIISKTDSKVLRHVCPFGGIQYMQESLRFQLDKFALGPQYVEEHLQQMIDSTKQHLKELYTSLVRPLASWLRTEHVIIVPHGRIHYLPFQAFLDGKEYMIDRHTISYAPSGSVLNYCLSKDDVTGSSPLIMGSSDENTPFVREELVELESLFPGARVFRDQKATRQAFFDEAACADFIHVAGHALFRPDNPMFSSFKLADGWVTALELYSTTCRANLVALSGCKSGVIEVSGADDLLGLMRGFLYAGARSLLLTLWAVNDRSTSSLMRNFYREWQGGRTRSEALRRATRAVRDEYPHPFHWAPFVLVGKP